MIGMNSSRLKNYLREAKIHIERLNEVLKEIKKIYPLDVEKFKQLTIEQKNMLDTLAFRFSKLQDLVGTKIFREFLDEVGFITEGKNFLKILKEIEKEGIIDIDTWSEFRKVRNLIAHDYPEEWEEKIEVVKKIESKTK